jgi:hypothetical protein
MFRLEAIDTGGKMNPSGNLSFAKITLVGWMGVEPRTDGIALAENICDLDEGIHDWGTRAMPRFSSILRHLPYI